MTGLFLPNPDPFRIVSIGTKRRCSACADPFIAAFMPFLLFFQPLFQSFHQLLEAAELLNFIHFLFAEEFLGDFAKPFIRQFLHVNGVRERVEAFEDMSENFIEFVDVPFVFDQRRSR
ncbi:MAG: Uncharacterised protein [Hyphomonas sp. TMED17]|nr:MAG: Uncharacterised protein [Hyphomonas sp. TMED17]